MGSIHQYTCWTCRRLDLRLGRPHLRIVPIYWSYLLRFMPASCSVPEQSRHPQLTRGRLMTLNYLFLSTWICSSTFYSTLLNISSHHHPTGFTRGGLISSKYCVLTKRSMFFSRTLISGKQWACLNQHLSSSFRRTCLCARYPSIDELQSRWLTRPSKRSELYGVEGEESKGETVIRRLGVLNSRTSEVLLGEVSMRATRLRLLKLVSTVRRHNRKTRLVFRLLHLAPHTFHSPILNNVSPLLSSESVATFSLNPPQESDTSNAIVGLVPLIVGQSVDFVCQRGEIRRGPPQPPLPPLHPFFNIEQTAHRIIVGTTCSSYALTLSHQCYIWTHHCSHFCTAHITSYYWLYQDL